MSNMRYCRFQNTSNDLQDCIEALSDMRETEWKPLETLSKEEYQAFIRLIQQAGELVRMYEDYGVL